jgi:hypothetical protein
MQYMPRPVGCQEPLLGFLPSCNPPGPLLPRRPLILRVGVVAMSEAQEVAAVEGGAREGAERYRPWREAGWIFKEGEILVIERRGRETRTRRVSEGLVPERRR